MYYTVFISELKSLSVIAPVYYLEKTQCEEKLKTCLQSVKIIIVTKLEQISWASGLYVRKMKKLPRVENKVYPEKRKGTSTHQKA